MIHFNIGMHKYNFNIPSILYDVLSGKIYDTLADVLAGVLTGDVPGTIVNILHDGNRLVQVIVYKHYAHIRITFCLEHTSNIYKNRYVDV